MRIYEVDKQYHVDLSKVAAIRQHFESVKKPDRRSRLEYQCWIEITLESGRHIEVDCANFEAMQEIYSMMLQTWKYYVGDYEEQSILYQTVNHDNN